MEKRTHHNLPNRGRRNPDYVLGTSILTTINQDVDIRPLEQLMQNNYPPSGFRNKAFCTTIPYHLEPLLLQMVQHHATRSVLWVFLRCIPEPPNDDESQEVALATFQNEFFASQVRFADHQMLGYYGMTTEDNWLHHLVPSWAGMAKSVCDKFCNRIKRFWNIYPQVNRSKNTSRETAYLYQLYHPERDVRDIKTVDLEVHYAETGQKIGGACELRSSWKFNELKPRFYYAQGGRDYFVARYIKPFAVALMEAVSCTEMKKRRDPAFHIISDPDDYLVMWDLTAFTSTLHELRYFLYWVIRGLEDRGDPSVVLLDYKDGLVTVKATDLLHEYNETVNINAPFSIHRIIDKYALHDDFETADYQQQNSGMLGVPGNIGFSTACHGYAIDQVSEREKSLSVGDDGFSSRYDDPFEVLFPQIKNIGRLHLGKTQTIPPGFDGPGKFVKRRLERTEYGFFIDFLLKLPLPVLIDERYGGRSPPDMDDYRRAKNIATTMGGLVWSITEHFDELDTHDFTILEEFMKICYASFKFSFHGALPGSSFHVDGVDYTATFAYPPIIFSESDGFWPFQTDWLEYLFDRPLDGPVSIPVMVPRSDPMLPEVGDTFYAPQNKCWKVLEDLAIVEDLGIQTERVSYIGEANRRRLRAFIKHTERDLFALYEYRLLKEVPDRFLFMYAPAPVDDYMSILECI